MKNTLLNFVLLGLIIFSTAASSQTLDVALGTKTPICSGDKITLRVTPKNNLTVDHFEWSTNETTTSLVKEILIQPQITQFYSVTIFEKLGTTYVIEKKIDVMPLPKVNAGKDTTICKGSAYLLDAQVPTGATMEWNTFVGVNQPMVEIGATTTTDYIVSATDINNCVNADTVKVNVIGSNAVFNYNGISKTNIGFADMSVGGTSMKRYWDFSDGITSNSTTPQHDFKADGFYDVCLTVIDPANGCQNKKCDVVKIGTPKCDARFTNVQSPKGPNELNFAITNLSLNTAYFWNFGDGTTSSLKSPNHAFKNEGFYTVTLGVYDSVNKCKEFFTQEVKIGQPRVKSDFNYFIDLANRTVVFKAAAMGKVKGFVWDFGNNKPALMNVIANPVVKYEKQGLYKVCLAVSDDSNHVDVVCKNIIVDTSACFAKFNTLVDSASSTVFFRNATLGKDVQYFWEYGDGIASTKYEPFHKYKKPGLYHIALTIANEKTDCFNKYTKVVLVSNMEKDCNADFNFQDDNISKVYFGNVSMALKGTKNLWDFGDGNKSTDVSPIHVFKNKGYYNVCLTSVNADNTCKDTRCKNIRVGVDTTKVLADFNYQVMNDTLSVLFADKSIGEVKDIKWFFGDGTTSNEMNLKHTYAKPGFYKVTQVVGDFKTKKYTTSFDLVPVGLGEGIQCAFAKIVDTSNNAKGVWPVEFKGASYGEPSSFSWDFGDGSIDTTNMSPTHVFANDGLYFVCYTVYDEIWGDSITYCDTVEVGVTNVKDIKLVDEFRVNPNPVKSKAQINYFLSANTHVDMELYDLVGNKVKAVVNENQSAGMHNLELDVNSFKNGVYFLQVNTGSSTSTYKVMVVK